MSYRYAEHLSYLTFGLIVVLLVELVAGLPAHQKRSTEKYIIKLEDFLVVGHEIARKNLSDENQRHFAKVSKCWTEPYTVVKKFTDGTYQIGKGKDRLLVHVDNLKTCICH